MADQLTPLSFAGNLKFEPDDAPVGFGPNRPLWADGFYVRFKRVEVGR